MSVPQNKFQLEHCCRMNVFYHENRERHFARCIRWTAFVSVLLSSAAVASLSDLLLPTALQSYGIILALGFALLVAIGNAAALAFDWYGQLSTHSKFEAKWAALLGEAGLLADNNRIQFESLVRQLVALNSDEPPQVEEILREAEAKADSAYEVVRRTT